MVFEGALVINSRRRIHGIRLGFYLLDIILQGICGNLVIVISLYATAGFDDCLDVLELQFSARA